MRRRRWAAVLAVVAFAVAGCAADDPELTAAASDVLGARVDAVRAAAEAGDRAGAEAALAALVDEIDAQENGGELSDDRAVELRLAAEEAEAALSSLPAPATTTTAAPPPPPPPDDKDDDEDEGDDDDEGRGKGNKKDD